MTVTVTPSGLLLVVAAGTAALASSAPTPGRLRSKAPIDERHAYPNVDSPIAIEPPLPYPSLTGGTPCATVKLIASAKFNSWGQVASAYYVPPTESCAGPWQQVRLVMTGQVAGVQYDRYGWVTFTPAQQPQMTVDEIRNATEVLRFTTPEPSPAGITWEVDKDITDYEGLFASSGYLNMSLSNIANAQYTGIFDMSVSLVFYQSGDQVNGGTRTVLTLSDYPDGVVLSDDVVEVRLDLYASGHDCEEFWYANYYNKADEQVPAGVCAGGAYRELNVFVDGQLAGAQYPFPVLYTGGFNPLLWRPLTGIMSFNIPAYRFDLTPFLGLLVDGRPHKITFGAFGEWHGNWVQRGVLVLYHDPTDRISSGTVTVRADAPAVTQSITAGVEVVQVTQGARTYQVSGTLLMQSGRTVENEVSGQMNSYSAVTDVSENEQEILGQWHTAMKSVRDGKTTTTVFQNSLSMSAVDSGTAKCYHMIDDIRFGRKVTMTYKDSSASTPPYRIVLNNDMQSSANYGKCAGGSKQEGASSADFSISVSAAGPQAKEAGPVELCHKQHAESINGAVSANHVDINKCHWPHGVYVCGSDVCGRYKANSPVEYAPGTAARWAQRHRLPKTADVFGEAPPLRRRPAGIAVPASVSQVPKSVVV